MMHKKVIKLLGALTITLLIVMTPIMVLATNEGVSVVNILRITQTKILSMHLQIMQVQKKWIYLILIQSQIWEEAKEHF